MIGWDKIYIGTLGFAQVGEPQYTSKLKVEKQVITSFFLRSEKYKVPSRFIEKARFSWDLYLHDFGSYEDFNIVYDRDYIDDLESEYEDEDILEIMSEEEFLKIKEEYEDFWKWANSCEKALQEHKEVLIQWCNELYQNTITMDIVYRNIDVKNNGLKAV